MGAYFEAAMGEAPDDTAFVIAVLNDMTRARDLMSRERIAYDGYRVAQGARTLPKSSI
jgi:hypothetical protein